MDQRPGPDKGFWIGVASAVLITAPFVLLAIYLWR